MGSNKQLEQTIVKLARVSGAANAAQAAQAIVDALRANGVEVGPKSDATVQALREDDNIVWST